MLNIFPRVYTARRITLSEHISFAVRHARHSLTSSRSASADPRTTSPFEVDILGEVEPERESLSKKEGSKGLVVRSVYEQSSSREWISLSPGPSVDVRFPKNSPRFRELQSKYSGLPI